MTIRITGMNSGLDTESIIKELASARSIKVQSVQKAQTKLSWKVDAWKSLNSKIYSFYTDFLSDMRYEGTYSKKTTTVSNTKAVSVITGDGAVNGVQELKVKQLAKAGYLTGASIRTKDDAAVTSKTTLAELGIEDESISFSLKIGSDANGTATTETLTFSKDSSVSDIVSALKEKGLNANFDEKNGRFFVSSKDTGDDYEFNLTAEAGSASETALKKLGMYVNSADPMNAAKTAGMATKISGQDAVIELNGAEFRSNTDSFEINGLTFTALEETGDEVVRVTTAADTSGVYDMIVDFFKQYNELINEMDKLYNADSAKGYEPLTDEEKDALSDTEVEKWETKIKDSLLRRDTTLSSVSSALKSIMSQGVTMKDGSTKYLMDYGIETLSYFIAEDNEKNAYHIAGNPNEEDKDTKNKADKLKSAITNNPDELVEFFTTLAKNLYSSLTEKMERTDYSSAFTVYNDKQMTKELTDYDTRISNEQKKLDDYLDKMYSKFSSMETALAKMQNQESALSGLFG